MKASFTFVTLLPFILASPVHEINGNDNLVPNRARVNVGQQRDIPAAAKFNPSMSPNGNSPSSSGAQPDDTLDYKAVWRRCPENNLVCEKCPGDMRCQSPIHKQTPTSKSGSKPMFNSKPGSKIRPKRPRPNAFLTDPSEPAALTGPQLAHSRPIKQDSTAGPCSLKRCGEGRGECHSSTKCIRGFCRCQSDFKAASGKMSRGWKYPESATVYVDAGEVCNAPCQRQFCAEIPRTSGCFEDPKAVANDQELPEAKKGGGFTKEDSSGDSGDFPVGSGKGGNGAIQIPGASIGREPGHNGDMRISRVPIEFRTGDNSVIPVSRVAIVEGERNVDAGIAVGAMV